MEYNDNIFNVVFLTVIIGGFYFFFRLILNYNKITLRIILANSAISRGDISGELLQLVDEWDELEYSVRLKTISSLAEWTQNKILEVREELDGYLSSDGSEYVVPEQHKEKIMLLSFFEEVEKLFVPAAQIAELPDITPLYDQYVALWGAFIVGVPQSILQSK